MSDEEDLKLARECAAEVTAGHVAPLASDAIRSGNYDGHIAVRSALLAIKAERARTVADLRQLVERRIGGRKSKRQTGNDEVILAVARHIERGDHVREGEGR